MQHSFLLSLNLHCRGTDEFLDLASQHESSTYKCKSDRSLYYKLDGDCPYIGQQLLQKVSRSKCTDDDVVDDDDDDGCVVMMTYYFHNDDVKVLLVRMLTNINMVVMTVLDLRDGCVKYYLKERCGHLKNFPKSYDFCFVFESIPNCYNDED